LFGLQRALRDQGRDTDAWFVEKQFHESWKGDAQLKVEDLV
jgi:hypothetical protein